MTGPSDQGGFGRRVAALRKRLGYSQTEFARKVGRSETWLSQVERGVRRIDRMSVLERLADALDVPVAELAPESPAAANAEPPAAASDLALALVSNHALRGLFSPGPGADLDTVEAGASTAWAHTHASGYEDLATLLEDLVPDAETIPDRVAAEDRPRAHTARARVYLAAAGALTALGDTAGAWVAIDRASGSARQVGDVLLVAECAFRLAIAFLAGGRRDLAARVAGTAADALAGGADADPAAIALVGALRLQLAVVRAHDGDADAAYRYLEQARTAGELVGAGRNDHDTEFGPANVELHEVAVAAELGDAGRALRVADRIDAEQLSPERRGRLLLDVARASAQLRRTDGVITALVRGLEIAPEQVSVDGRARSLVGDLVRDHGDDPRVRALSERIAPS